MNLNEIMKESAEKWKDTIIGLEIRIKELEWKEKHETDENKREEISKELKGKTERLLQCQKRLAECESY